MYDRDTIGIISEGMSFLVRRRVISRLCAMIVIAILASGAGYMKNSASAQGTAIKSGEALEQVVSLHEKLQGNSVEVPMGMYGSGLDDGLLKSVVLGYVNLDEAEALSELTMRKQDMMSALYKTVISYDDSFAISSDEAEIILNNCYDNAYIDDANRLAYAFMIKHGVIRDIVNSEPDKEITDESCKVLVDLIYKMFFKTVTVNTGETDITIGSNVNELISSVGEPNRVDVSEYGFEWYVYNENYDNFMMVGVHSGRICALYTNNAHFSVGEISSGDDYTKTLSYDTDENVIFYTDTNGKIDAVLYVAEQKGSDNTQELVDAKCSEFIDLINSYRSKNSLPIYVQSQDLSEDCEMSMMDFAAGLEVDESVSVYRSYSVFNMYNEYVNDGSRFIYNDNKYPESIGVSAYIDENDNFVAGLVDSNGSVAKLQSSYTVSLNSRELEVEEIGEVTTPILLSPTPEQIYNAGDDVVIELAMQASDQYHIEVFDIENDEYAVNKYITTDSTTITLPSELFTDGCDYRMIVNSILPDGSALPSEEVLISYGTAFDTGVDILTPYNAGVTDDDYLYVSWDAEKYHDFCVDLYDGEGNLVTSKVIEDEHEALIQGVTPGEYFVYVTALRRGTKVEKSQDFVFCTVKMPEPVVEEIILDENDTYYFVYEDEDMGVVYLYDEELINVKENGQTVTKKKIIRKQVKATRAYKELCDNQIKREYTTGEPMLVPTMVTASTKLGQEIVNTAAKYLGVDYVWGGTTPDGFDCSGLVQYVMKSLGINVSRTSQEQIKNGVPVSKGDLQAGDLVFFESNGDVHHVGIYVGNGMMIHAPRTGDVVRYQSIETPYYQSEYAGARRVY